MADVFISYSKQEREVTAALATDLEQQGYTVWWDTGLVPGDAFEEVILSELDLARAAIVIWTPHSIKSMWVRSEARRAADMAKLVPVRASSVTIREIPPPFDGFHIELVDNRPAILAALEKLGVKPTLQSVATDASDSLARTEWERVRESTSIDELEAFERHFGWTSFGLLAKSRRDGLMFARAESTGSLAEFARYMQMFPDGKHVWKARDRGSQLSFAAAEKADTPEAFERHLQDWPGGPVERKAREWLAQYALRLQRLDQAIAQDVAQDANGSPGSAVQQFVNSLPSDALRQRWVKLATPRIEAAREPYAFEKAKREDCEEGYARYLTTYPQGLHAKDALEAIEKLAWKVAQSSDAARSYAAFSTRFPNGIHRKEAVLSEQRRRLLHTLRGHLDRINDIAFSPNGDLIVSGGDDAAVRVWDRRQGVQIQTLWHDRTRRDFKTPDGKENYYVQGKVTAVAVSPDGRFLLSRGWDAVKLWTLADGKERQTFPGGLGYGNVAFSPDGRLAASQISNNVVIWNIAQDREFASVAFPHLINSIVFAANDQLYLEHSVPNEQKVWTSTLWSLRIQAGKPRSMASSRPSFLSQIFRGENIREPIDTKAHLITSAYPLKDLKLTSRVMLSPCGGFAISHDNDEAPILWSLDTRQMIFVFPRKTDWPRAFSADGSRILLHSRDDGGSLWSTETFEELVTFKVPPSYPTSLSPDCTVAAGVSSQFSKEILLLDIS